MCFQLTVLHNIQMVLLHGSITTNGRPQEVHLHKNYNIFKMQKRLRK